MIKDVKINEDSIKNFLQNDLINRNKYLNIILSHLNQAEENEIIALDGDWGCGKTVFLKEIEFLLKSENISEYTSIDKSILESNRNEYMVYYYNAWENDDAPNAMLSLLYKIINDNCKDKEKDETSLIPRLLNTVIKFATNGSVDIKADLFGEQWNNKQITDAIKTSEEIKETFNDLIDNLLVENKSKMLIIIDEVDRCKPIFAVELLESIKHFYNNDKVVFIVGTNNRELGHTICKVYGDSYDGYGYLDRFFDIVFELPYNYIENYFDRVVLDEGRGYDIYIPKELAKQYKLTMREYNRYKTALKIAENYFNITPGFGNKSYIYFLERVFVPIALMLKIKNKEEYYNFINGKDFNIIENFILSNKYAFEIFDLVHENDRNLHNYITEIRNNSNYSDDEKDKMIIEKEKEVYKRYYNDTISDKIRKDTIEGFAIERMKDVIAMME